MGMGSSFTRCKTAGTWVNRSHLTCAKLKSASSYTSHPWYVFTALKGTILFHNAFSAEGLTIRNVRTRYGPNIRDYSNICCQNWGNSRNVNVHSIDEFEVFALLRWACVEQTQAASAVRCPPFRCVTSHTACSCAIAKFRKAAINFIMFVYPSVRPRGTISVTQRIFMKFNTRAFFRNSVEKIQDLLKSDMNDGYFTWRPIYISDHISPSSSWNEKCFRQSCRVNRNTYLNFNDFFF